MGDGQIGEVDVKAGLGRVGVWVFAGALESDPGGLAATVEQLGYGALWVGGGNVDGASLDRLGGALSATSRLVLATGIANIWAWDPAALASRAAALEEAHPGRFVLGLGVSHAPLVEGLGLVYERPLQAMVDFLDALDALDALDGRGRAGQGRRGVVPPRVLAALGERMLELSRDRSAGAHPYLTPPSHTAEARRVLGPGPLLAPEQAVTLDEDVERARATGRAYLVRYLAAPNYTRNLERLGYRSEDLEEGGSDTLVDALVPHGSPEDVAASIRAHLEAGADHVCVQPLAPDGAIDLEALERLAPLLLGSPPGVS